jgi:hypothetical protein
MNGSSLLMSCQVAIARTTWAFPILGDRQPVTWQSTRLGAWYSLNPVLVSPLTKPAMNLDSVFAAA